MKLRSFIILSTTSTCLALTVLFSASCSQSSSTALTGNAVRFDGTNPTHAVDTAGNSIQQSSVTQPDKPIILSKDSKNPKWGEFRSDKAFDHAKHNSDVAHTRDGKSLTACVHCHHTEQPSASAGETYLKRFERKEVLTAEQLKTSNDPVKSCRACHVQDGTTTTDGFPPDRVKYPKEIARAMEIAAGAQFQKLTNQFAYHIRCISCHDAVMNAPNRDPKLNAPQECGDCHVKKE